MQNKSSVQSYSGRNSVTSYNKNGRQSVISKSPPGPTLSEADETELEDNPKKPITKPDEEKVTSFTVKPKKDDILY